MSQPATIVYCLPPAVYNCIPAAASPVTVAPIPRTVPKQMPLAQPLAKPTPAPSSSGGEPPLAAPSSNPKRAPIITESRASAPLELISGTKDEKGRCRVGFWNITGRDVTLKIDGQERVLPKDRAITILLQRSFVWQMDGREAQGERVPDDRHIYEVILRP